MKHNRRCEECSKTKPCRPYWYFLCDECAKKMDRVMHEACAGDAPVGDPGCIGHLESPNKNIKPA
ncbi:MAG TPA: hypothetical protein VMU17_05730 [Elusimicrobiota bacterium]|nr:hypothetical protein [Elusimicrobiota bacterium]